MEGMTQYSLRNKKYLMISIAVIILVWQVVAISFNNRLLLPSFFDVLNEMHRIISREQFLRLVFNSIFRCIKSFIVSIIILPIGTLISGMSFLLSANLIVGLPGSFEALFLVAVAPAIIINLVFGIFFFKVISMSVNRLGYKNLKSLNK